jgi:hypothetical protein
VLPVRRPELMSEPLRLLEPLRRLLRMEAVTVMSMEQGFRRRGPAPEAKGERVPEMPDRTKRPEEKQKQKKKTQISSLMQRWKKTQTQKWRVKRPQE